VVLMRNLRAQVMGGALVPFVVISALSAVPLGCGEEKAKETGNAAVPPSIQKANNEMENFAKGQAKKK
jgi:hypothetical protein